MESIDFSTNVNALMERIRDQQADIERIQRELEVMEVVGASREDEVRVTVRGNGQVIGVDIDEQAMRENDAYELGELVKEAVNDGLRRVAETGSRKFQPMIDAAQAAPGS
ncbi:YbaB/EbfC family nucleoid-associated protein [Catenulispora sp. NF23]|uniref:YbaB/EbfC family nucleoid-associated protein n=1 Tax=Catenulispora pinistramenti TaxID=2705254 RepID=A0ABS5L0S9_9ACTN|nr:MULTISPECIES: YbaB/EbfC family nucleoid-associated protein [Catenulispora]MBS2540014.1 YbaB/EbfC family nucleoid-associated protein [Catenulispora pinistramenti]MBS2551937.1 YbaB/EbfC family nucleoid-associated protein [Catenulispora pinistramenti]